MKQSFPNSYGGEVVASFFIFIFLDMDLFFVGKEEIKEKGRRGREHK